MASSDAQSSLIFFTTSTLLIIFLIAPSFAQQSFPPKVLVAPVSKDASTLQYVTRISQRTPLVPLNLVLDLGGQYLWVDCDQSYVSSTYRPVRCRSAPCSLARSNSCGDCFSGLRPGCNNNTCGAIPDSTVTEMATSGEHAEDVVSIQSTDGSNPGRIVTDSTFIFTCAPTFLLKGLASGVSVVFFGEGPYILAPDRDVSKSLIYTPLFLNPVSTASAFALGDTSLEYFIGVKSIKVNDRVVPVNTTLLSFDSKGVGGTKISTVNPYTVLESSIYKSVTETFVKESAAMNITRVASVTPFEFCFSSKSMYSTRVGASVPTIDLVLQNGNMRWSILGSNSMVQVREGVLCLGFVNGCGKPRTSIVIGGYQLENNLLQFDLATSRLGFSSSLLALQTRCSNFNFTSNA
ncbi:hypothetical protein FNV43_RR23409 [Rhamnella rubrinervis]|uniref:Peptidase A1 domain-containing protein n=1 Tax=Rhamnella rubrinervis TaxID=2594499 RepID=A0A8K0GP48_9ROSA|nr:hypothetical protein FNV43_RR23409 [Rhamnella rubrinervis]